jgi:PAS domain S-box-containing protein
MEQFLPTVAIDQQPVAAASANDWLALTRRLMRCSTRAAMYDLVFTAARLGNSAFTLLGYLDSPPVGTLMRLVALDMSQAAPLQRGTSAPAIAPIDGALSAQLQNPPATILVSTLDQDSSGLRALLEGFELPTRSLGTVYAVRLACAHESGPLIIMAWRAGDTPAPAWLAALPAFFADVTLRLDTFNTYALPTQNAPAAFDFLSATAVICDIGLLYGGQLDRLLKALLRHLVETLGLQGAAFFLHSDLNERLALADVVSHDASTPVFWEAPQLDRLLRIARTIEVSGRTQIYHDPLGSGTAQTLVVVPLLAGGWSTGVLQLLATEQALSREQLPALAMIGNYIAASIENARLFAWTRADQERTRAVVDATNDAIVMLDERRRTMIFNRRARFFFGLAERDVLGRDNTQLNGLMQLIFVDAPRFNQWLAELLDSPFERAVEEFLTLRPEQRLLQCYSAPVMDDHERYLGRILVFRDITREREVERMKNDFISIVSHELRTPLTSIRGALQLVLGKTSEGQMLTRIETLPQARNLLTISLANTERLIRLINDILDISKIEQGRMQLKRERVSAVELCRIAAAEVAALATTRSITVEVLEHHALPTIYADRDRTVQVLVNLLSNAIKFSQLGQRVQLSTQSEGPMVRFVVRDWGRGIAPEDQPRLFQKFQQLDNPATREVGGSGLGLAICKAIVEEHGGTIGLVSTPDSGSSFFFTMPLLLPEQQSPVLQRGTVLVVDDDADVRPVLVRLIQRHGFAVFGAADGQTALALWQQEQPDVVLLDLRMPGMDGYEVLRHAQANAATAGIPAIILSANELSDRSRDALTALGAVAYLEKPVPSDRLISALEQVLASYRATG